MKNRWLFIPLLPLFFSVLPLACGGSDPAASSLALNAQTELFPSFDFDTGLQPKASPVQASFALKATGNAAVNASAVASDANGGVALYAVPGSGKIALSGSFTLQGKLKIAVTGLPSYDGDIPGIENVNVAFDGTQALEPFGMGKETVAQAAIPKTQLPDIPLPGGIPGHLAIAVADGSFVRVGFTPTCAGTDGKTASLGGTLTRGGTLVLQPSIEIDVPLVGKKSFPIPDVTVDLGSLPSSDLHAEANVTTLGDPPKGAEAAKPACVGGGSGGAGGGTSSSGSTAQGTSTTTGASTSAGGTCNDGIDLGQYPELASCVEKHCCAAVDSCTMQGTDAQSCVDCVNGGGTGPLCQALEGCAVQCDGGKYAVCNGIFGVPSVDDVQCIDASCCNDVMICSQGGADPVGCEQCLEAGGGPACDGLRNCASLNCGIVLTGGF